MATLKLAKSEFATQNRHNAANRNFLIERTKREYHLVTRSPRNFQMRKPQFSAEF